MALPLQCVSISHSLYGQVHRERSFLGHDSQFHCGLYIHTGRPKLLGYLIWQAIASRPQFALCVQGLASKTTVSVLYHPGHASNPVDVNSFSIRCNLTVFGRLLTEWRIAFALRAHQERGALHRVIFPRGRYRATRHLILITVNCCPFTTIYGMMIISLILPHAL